MRGTTHAGDALGPERHVEQRGRSGAVGRDETLGERDDAGAIRHAEPAQLGDGLADALRGDGEENQVRARDGVALSPERLDPEIARELHAREVVPVLVRTGQLVGLLARTAQERGPKPSALEQHGDGRAKRAGTDDRGTTRMLARVADGPGR